MFVKKFFVAIFISLGWSTLYCQEDNGKTSGEIEDVEVQIIKDRQIKLLKAHRNFEKITPVFDTPKPVMFSYQFQQFDFDIPDLTFRIRPLRIKSEPLSKLYGGYVKGGFGNYTTPYLEAFFSNKRDRQYAYGAHIKHLSSKSGSVDGNNSGVGETNVEIFGKTFTDKLVLGGSIGYQRNSMHYYGYPDNLDIKASDIEQKYDWIKINTHLKSNQEKNPLKYKLALGYTSVKDKNSAKEGVFNSDLGVEYELDKDKKLEIQSQIKIISRKDSKLSDSRTVANIIPTYGFVYNDFKIKAGINIAYENDTLESMNKVHLYPDISASYQILTDIELYTRIHGGIQPNTLQSVVSVNPFLVDNPAIYHTNRLFEFVAGVQGKLGNASYAHAGFSMAKYKYFQYMVNVRDQSRFTLIYDSLTTTVSNIFAEWTMTKSHRLHLSMRGDYFLYNTGAEAEAWHQPTYKIALISRYNLFDKIILEGRMVSQGGIKARNTINNQTIKLDPAFDLGLQGTYLFSKQFSIYLKFNNIFSNNYEILYRYPVRGLQVMAGVTYTF